MQSLLVMAQHHNLVKAHLGNDNNSIQSRPKHAQMPTQQQHGSPEQQQDEGPLATDVVVSHLLRLPSASPSSTRWPQAAMVVLCTSPLLRMPQLGFLGLQSVTCSAKTLC